MKKGTETKDTFSKGLKMRTSQDKAKGLYRRIRDMREAAKAALYEAYLLHNELSDLTLETLGNAKERLMEEVGQTHPSQREIFKTLQDTIDEEFIETNIAELWQEDGRSIH